MRQNAESHLDHHRAKRSVEPLVFEISIIRRRRHESDESYCFDDLRVIV
jgi:hypothetical protein